MSSTIRQVSNAVGLVIAGAMRDVDNGVAQGDSAPPSFTDVMCGVARELSDWLEGEPEVGAIVVAEYFMAYLQPDNLRAALARLESAQT